jgi:hypothetical protein
LFWTHGFLIFIDAFKNGILILLLINLNQMKNLLILTILFLGVSFTSKAQTVDSLSVDSLAKEYLLNHYGSDDHAKAIIEYSFSQTKYANLKIFAGGTSLLASTYFFYSFSHGGGYEILVFPIIGLGLGVVGITTIVDLIQTKKELNPFKIDKILSTYFNTGELPKSFKKNRRYGGYTKFLPDNNKRIK